MQKRKLGKRVVARTRLIQRHSDSAKLSVQEEYSYVAEFRIEKDAAPVAVDSFVLHEMRHWILGLS